MSRAASGAGMRKVPVHVSPCQREITKVESAGWTETPILRTTPRASWNHARSPYRWSSTGMSRLSHRERGLATGVLLTASDADQSPWPGDGGHPMNDEGLQRALVRQAFAAWSAYQREWTMTPECSVRVALSDHLHHRAEVAPGFLGDTPMILDPRRRIVDLTEDIASGASAFGTRVEWALQLGTLGEVVTQRRVQTLRDRVTWSGRKRDKGTREQTAPERESAHRWRCEWGVDPVDSSRRCNGSDTQQTPRSERDRIAATTNRLLQSTGRRVIGGADRQHTTQVVAVTPDPDEARIVTLAEGQDDMELPGSYVGLELTQGRRRNRP
jgi:hypothetical protein